MSTDEPAQSDEQPGGECPPCRGSGQVVSNLGGSSSTVTCPWCDGTGRLEPGRDAQARWRDRA